MDYTGEPHLSVLCDECVNVCAYVCVHGMCMVVNLAAYTVNFRTLTLNLHAKIAQWVL